MREGMHRATCAVYAERWEDCLCYRKYNGIAQSSFEHVSKRNGEAKSICLNSTPTPWNGTSVGFLFFGVQFIISVKESEGSMLGSAHASTTYETNFFKLHNRLYYRKQNGIAQFKYEHVSQRCGEAKCKSI